MTPGPALATLSALLAFIVGFAAFRGGTCAVLAARQIVEKGRWQRLRAFISAACWSAALIIPLSWAWPGLVRHAPHMALEPGVVLGALAYGVGAWANGACAFGTVVRVGSGDAAYATFFPGALAGYLAALSMPQLAPLPVDPVPALSRPGPAAWAALALAAAVVLFQLVRAGRLHRFGLRRAWRWLRSSQWRPAASLAVMGIAGGLLFSLAGTWTYMQLMRRTAALLKDGGPPIPWEPIAGAVATFSGAILAAVLAGKCRPRFSSGAQLVRSGLGGAAMAFGAVLIPGGNDMLVLYGLPSFALSALVAYVVMMVVVVQLVRLEPYLGFGMGKPMMKKA